MGKLLLALLLLFPSVSQSILGVAYSPDGKMLITTGICRPVVLRDPATGKELRRLSQQSSWLGNAAFTPDGNSLLTTIRDDKHGDNHIVALPVPERGEPALLGKMPGDAWIGAIVLSADGKIAASIAGDDPVILWDVTARKELRRLQPKGYQTGLAMTPDGKYVASASIDNPTVQVWEVATGKEAYALHPACSCLAFSPDGKLIALGSYPKIVLWNLETNKEVRSLNAGAACIAFSPDGKMLATGLSKTLRTFDVSTGKALVTAPAMGMITSLAISPDGKRIAAGLYEPGGVQSWSLEDGKELFQIPLPPNETK